MNNSVNVNTVNKLRNNVDTRFLANSKEYQKLVSKASFVSQEVI